MTLVRQSNLALFHNPLTRLAARISFVATLAVLTVSVPAFVIGARWEGEHFFLKSYRTPDWAEANIKNTMDYVNQNHEANDVIFIGDSTTTIGIQPILFEQATGLRGYNLGLPGFVGMNSNLRLVERYIEIHPIPKLLVYSAHPKDYGLVPENWGGIQDRFARSYGVWSGGAPLKQNLSIVHCVREGIRIVFGELRGGQNHYFGPNVVQWEKLVSKQRGFFGSPGKLEEKEIHKPPPSRTFSVSPWYADHLHALAELTLRRGIPLFIRPTPVLLRTQQEDAVSFIAWLREFKSKYSHVQLGNDLILTDNPQSFGDSLHMNITGAERFTRILSNQVNSHYPELKSQITHHTDEGKR